MYIYRHLFCERMGKEYVFRNLAFLLLLYLLYGLATLRFNWYAYSTTILA